MTLPDKEVVPVAVVSDARGFVPPTTPPNVDVPDPFTSVNEYGVAPLLSTVELNVMLELLLAVSVVLLNKLTAPEYTCAPDVVIALPRVEAPLTERLEVPEVLITALPEAMVKLPTVSAARRSKTPFELIVSAAADEPKADAPVTISVPPLMVVPPVYELLPDRVCVPACKTILPPVPPIDPLNESLLAAVIVSDLDPKTTEPAPARLLMLVPEVVALISKAPVAVTTEESAMDPLPVKVSDPVLIVVAPV